MPESGYLGSGARLVRGPADSLAASAFARELASSKYLLGELSLADMAHVAMLHQDGVIGPNETSAILDALVGLHPSSGDIPIDPTVGDLYNNRDRFLSGKLGDLAGVIHTGRARREATTLAWQLACRDRLLAMWGSLIEVVDVLHRLAEAHGSTVMPDYTYLQHAHPTTLGHYLLGFAFPLARDIDRARRALELMNRCPAGSGSVNGSQIPMDRAWVADLLGFDAVIEHTRDAMWAPDLATEAMSAVVTTMTNVDRLSEDLQIWATEEFGFVDLDDSHSRTSVIMPQKKNPYALTHLRGEARNLMGRWVGVVATALTPSGQPDNRVFAYLDVPEALDRTTRSLLLLADLLERAKWDIDRMRGAASSGFGYATDMCDYLVVSTGVDNRTAHRVLGRAVRDATAEDSPLTAARVREAAKVLGVSLGAFDDDELERNRDPEHALALRRGAGGAGPEPMAAMLKELENRLVHTRALWEANPLHRFPENFLARIHAIADQTRPK
jgi:argininosuccinate lyase